MDRKEMAEIIESLDEVDNMHTWDRHRQLLEDLGDLVVVKDLERCQKLVEGMDGPFQVTQSEIFFYDNTAVLPMVNGKWLIRLLGGAGAFIAVAILDDTDARDLIRFSVENNEENMRALENLIR
jgi:hypothetical protein